MTELTANYNNEPLERDVVGNREKGEEIQMVERQMFNNFFLVIKMQITTITLYLLMEGEVIQFGSASIFYGVERFVVYSLDIIKSNSSSTSRGTSLQDDIISLQF